MLGLGSEAGRLVRERFLGATSRFAGFYRMHFDYTPEVDTGAVAKLALQVTRPVQETHPAAKLARLV